MEFLFIKFRFKLISLISCFFSIVILSAGQTTIISEDFTSASGTTPPTGWANNLILGNASEIWAFNNPGGRTINAPVAGQFAILDSDGFGNNSTAEEATLVTPVFNANIYSASLTLTFDHYFRAGYGGAYSVEVYNGSSWVSVLSGSASSTANSASESIDILVPAAGVTNAQVRFRWTGDYSWYWAIDNVRIEGETSGVLDTDGDGIPDNLDLDADNDGLSGEDECGCSADPFVNGGFESPIIGSSTYSIMSAASVNGWETTATDNRIEVWSTGFLGVPSQEGNQFVELNANQVSTLYQIFCLNGAGGIINWSLYHRGRAGTETANVRMGADLASSTVIESMTDGTSAWGFYSGTYNIPVGQTSLIIAFESVAGGSIGNFLDDIQIEITQSCKDTDGDGIPDNIDLDADNDGCNDTDEEGIYDPDGDGVAGMGTPAVDGNGLVTSITYVPAPNGYWQDLRLVSDLCDTDGDNINPLVDLDDDNDGILDDDERRACSGTDIQIASWTMNTGSSPAASYIDTDVTAKDQAPGPGWDSWSIPTSALVLNSTSLPQSLTEAVDGDFYIDYTILPGSGKVFEVDNIQWGFNDFTNTPKHDFKVSIYINKDNFTTPIIQDASRANDVDNYITSNNPLNNVFVKDISDSLVFRVYLYEPTVGIGGSAITNGSITFDDFRIDGYHMEMDDCDNDGIPNSYDLDSDDDECFDAVEGGMSFGLSDIDAMGVLTGAIDSDGVPIVALGGQGTTADVIDAAIRTQCPCLRVIINPHRPMRVQGH
ncbi:MAG: hypothetical protein AB8F94_21910 [Saprospiraceae bacterium]